MKLFECQHCRQTLYFENTNCERCGRALGFLPDSLTLSALQPGEGDLWRALAAPETAQRFCANAAYGACNWLLPAESSEAYCRACRHNTLVPDLTVAENRPRWRALEAAKRRLFYSLLRLGLPLQTRAGDPSRG